MPRMMLLGAGAPLATELTLLPTLTYTSGAVYSFNKLVAGYSGPTIRLIRASDSAESDFGYDATGLFDAATVTTWIGASSAKGTKWYDQSGNGNDATQTVDASRPTYETSFADGKPCWMGGNLNGNYSRFFNLPSGVAQNPQSFCSYTVYKCRNGYPSSPYWLGLPAIGMGTVPGGTTNPTDGAISIYNDRANGLTYSGHSGLGSRTAPVVPFDTALDVIGVVSQSGGVHTLAGTRYDAFSGTAISRFPGQSPAGGVIGMKFSNGTIAEGEMRAIIITPEHSVAVARTVRSALIANYSVPTTQTKMLWWVGDSISAGYNVTDQRWLAPGHLLAQSQGTYHVRVFACAGRRIDELNTAATTSSNNYNIDSWTTEMGAGNSVCLLWAGYNDFNQGASLATVQGRINTFIAARKLAGIDKVYVGTLIPVGAYIPTDSMRTDLNAWLMAGSADDDGVIDYAGQGVWAGKMQGDGVHLLASGNIEAQRVTREFLAAL